MACVLQEPEPQAPAICDHMPTILGYLEEHQVVVVSAEPGSGKSSVLPRCLVNSGYGPVICAQPRHFAATVAWAKAGEEWESDVVFTTTRLLLDAFCARTAVLASFGAVVIDEAHDRTLCTDVLLGMIRAAVATGKMGHLRVVVCTAGGPADGVLSGFFGVPIVAFQRAVHPVEVHYSRGPMLDMVGAVIEEVAGIHKSKPPGDVLAFLPEVVHVEEAYHRLRQLGLPGLVACRIHDHLPAELMGDALDPAPGGSRKVVLATDVAETAVLVPGIKYVVDTGVLSEEPLVKISKEAANRRSAVASTASPGHCHRLYTQDEYAAFDEHNVPLISRDGAHFMFALLLKRHAADGMPGFEFLDPSVAPALESVVDQLIAAGYLDKHGNLTEKGEREAYDED
ncbi:pre-mRNA-splicing factor ATP-dependent RNA helicase DEAH1-like [Phragmites australis]|uniref:pre-mRNA-splicing factor ATP-dependent RNA helicase DEAH1-like n=1 Tax=Phragmites australis TaxID=29695 RepID=UPI002D77949C|nr:pre-mRNA-splicing factor ATP-dependent RNA helicase DEAH1-like [Phragmites australis]